MTCLASIDGRITDPGDYIATAWVSGDGARIVTVMGTEFGSEDQITALPFYRTLAERISAAKRLATKCLSSDKRNEIFVGEDPLRWCITGAGLEQEPDPTKWQPLYPYQGPEWSDGLLAQDGG
ncbi:MAG: hypothetical protein ACR2QF_03275 [Geminicoccaceae bacterium]